MTHETCTCGSEIGTDSLIIVGEFRRAHAGCRSAYVEKVAAETAEINSRRERSERAGQAFGDILQSAIKSKPSTPAIGHRLTEHGHPCCHWYSGPAGEVVARCGGPALCSVCDVAAAAIHRPTKR